MTTASCCSTVTSHLSYEPSTTERSGRILLSRQEKRRQGCFGLMDKLQLGEWGGPKGLSRHKTLLLPAFTHTDPPALVYVGVGVWKQGSSDIRVIHTREAGCNNFTENNTCYLTVMTYPYVLRWKESYSVSPLIWTLSVEWKKITSDKGKESRTMRHVSTVHTVCENQFWGGSASLGW